jgi:hypothetical protein
MSDDRRQKSERQAFRSAAVSLHLPWPARARQHTQSPARGNTQGSIPMPDTGPMTGKGKPHPLLDRHPPVTRPATPQGTRIPKGRPAHTHHHTISRQGAAPPCRHTGPGQVNDPTGCRTRSPPPNLAQAGGRALVGPGRLERPTSRLSGVRSNQLSYGPVQRSEAKRAATRTKASSARHLGPLERGCADGALAIGPPPGSAGWGHVVRQGRDLGGTLERR